MKLVSCITCLLLVVAFQAMGQSYQPQGGYVPQPTYQAPTQPAYHPAPQPMQQQAPQSNYAQYPSDPYSGRPQPTQSYSSQNAPVGGGAPMKLLSYGYLEGRYNFNTFKNIDKLENGSGYGANLSVALMKPLFLHFGLNWLRGTSTTSSKDFTMSSFSVGGGAYLPLADRFHLFGEIGFRYDSFSGPLTTISKDDFAIYLRPGIRVAATDNLELEADLTFNSTDNLNNRIYSVQGYYALMNMTELGVDVGLGMDISKDVNAYHAGLRLRW